MAALLRPSSAPSWGVCSGSVMANMGAPDIDTEQKREGTAAHWVGESALNTGAQCHEFEGQVAPNGVRVDAEMCEAAQVYVDDVRAVLAEFGGEMHTELKVHMPRIHEQNSGTLDGQVIVLAAGRLFIWDFKYGRRRVDAKENLQLIDYAEGVREMLGLDGHAEQYTRIDLRVIQPRCYKPAGVIDTWSVMLCDLRPYWNQLHEKAHEALTNPTFTAGKQCRDCNALHRCDTAAMYSYSVYQYASQPYQINTLTDSELAAEYHNMSDALDIIKSRKEELYDELKHRTEAGKPTGKTIGTKTGAPKWHADKAAVIASFKAIGVDVSKSDVITPTQALQRTPAEHRPTAEAMVAQLAKRKHSNELIDAADALSSRVFKN